VGYPGWKCCAASLQSPRDTTTVTLTALHRDHGMAGEGKKSTVERWKNIEMEEVPTTTTTYQFNFTAKGLHG
ncbi:Phosphatidylinositol 4-phosphate 3-kinase C2 domain containing subunit gamma, partial [Dissostichus eleginoides]